MWIWIEEQFDSKVSEHTIIASFSYCVAVASGQKLSGLLR